MKLLPVLVLVGGLIAIGETKAVFNGEEEKPGLHEEVVIKQETQLAQGAVARVKQQASLAAAQNRPSAPSQAIAPSPVASASQPSAWVGWVENVVLLVVAVAVFYRMIKIA